MAAQFLQLFCLTVSIACSPHNDLLVTMKSCGLKPARFDSPTQAIAAAPPGSAVLLLDDGYPSNRLAVSEDLFRGAKAKDLHLYIEFPSFAPGVTFGAAQKTSWERFVISSKNMGGALPKGQLLMAHECNYLPSDAPEPLVVVGRVAGFDTAVYGIPVSAQPILFPLDGGRVLVATTKLSSFITGRFAPAKEWGALWKQILSRLCGDGVPDLKWEPRVRAMYGPKEKLPAGFEKRAFKQAANWCNNSGLLISDERLPDLQALWKVSGELTIGNEEKYTGGDGHLGILEGFSSTIRRDGSQPQRVPVRSDCNAETAMTLSLDSLVNGNARSRTTASNLLDFIYFNSDLFTGKRGDPKHPAFGLVSWGSTIPAWTVANYGDDNARVMLSTMLAAACLRSDRWNEPLLRDLAANLRTTGKLGFRGDRIDMPDLEQHGWRFYHEGAPVNYSPHFESYLWACYLWAYARTGEEEFLVKARTGIGMMMEVFPAEWRWNDNIERARMLLCLAWLTRVEDTEEHRHWVHQVADDLIGIQDPCGAAGAFSRNRGRLHDSAFQ